jgi:hypothetical protein
MPNAPKQLPVEQIPTSWQTCAKCGGTHTIHQVLYRHQVDTTDFFGDEWAKSYLSDLIQCQGCLSVKLRTYTVEPHPYPPSREAGQTIELLERIFPDDAERRWERKASIAGLKENEDGLIPADVHKMYTETCIAYDAGCLTLAGAGLRGTVEAICLQRGIKNGGLEAKINGLAESRLLALPDADLLHEERYLGNAAIHEMETPSLQDLEDGLQIIEGLINTIYLLPAKAQRMKAQRLEAKNKPLNP